MGEQPAEAPASEGRRPQIVRAALELLAERGYQGTSLGAIARRVGMSQPGLLHYFSSKDDLLMEALTEWERENDRRLSAVLGDTRSLPEFLTRLVELHHEQPQLVRSYVLLSAGSLATHHPTQEYFRARYRRVRAGLVASITEDSGLGLPAGLSAEQAASLCVAMLDGLELQWLLDPDEVDFAGAVASFLDLLGWRPQAGRTGRKPRPESG